MFSGEPLSRPPAIICHRVFQGNLPPKGVYSSVQWWYHYYKRHDKNLKNAFDEAVNYYERTRGFLIRSQILGLAFDWFAIPHVCGEIDKKKWFKKIRLQLKTLQKHTPRQIEEALKSIPIKVVSVPPVETHYCIFKKKAVLVAEREARQAETSYLDSTEYENILGASFSDRQSHQSFAPIYDRPVKSKLTDAGKSSTAAPAAAGASTPTKTVGLSEAPTSAVQFPFGDRDVVATTPPKPQKRTRGALRLNETWSEAPTTPLTNENARRVENKEPEVEQPNLFKFHAKFHY